MKQFFTISILAFLTVPTIGQTVHRELQVVQVITPQTFYLNSVARAKFDGKAKTCLNIQLPPNTVEWYYSFTTSTNDNPKVSLDLFPQLTKLCNPTGATNIAANAILTPSGSAVCNIYLMDKQHGNLFMTNDIINPDMYNANASRQNFKNGTVQIRDVLAGDWCLCFKNSNLTEGLTIIVEVVAIVSVQVYEDKWTLDNLNKIYNYCLGRFTVKNAEVEQICKCVKDKMLNNYKPIAFYQLSESSRNAQIQNEISNCTVETGNSSVVDKEKKIKELYEQYRGQNITKDYEAQEQTLIELIQYGVTNSDMYNSLGWAQLCLRKYEDAKKSLQTGLGKNPKSLYLLGNLGHYYLLTGKYEQAIAIFQEHKNKKIDGKKFKELISMDLKEFEQIGIKNPDFEKVRKKLKIK